MKMKILVFLFAVLCAIEGKRTVVDMSHYFNDNKTQYHPVHGPMSFKIRQRGWMTYKKVTLWAEFNMFTMHEHYGTHMDAPCHFTKAPGFWRLQEIPVERFIGDAVVIDIQYKADVMTNPNAVLEVKDITDWEAQHGMIKDGSIVFMYSGWDQYWGNSVTYLGTDGKANSSQFNFPGIGAEAAQWLVDHRNIFGIGVDSLSLDRGNSETFDAHAIILSSNIYGLESVKNLGKLPASGARVYVLPINMWDGSGGPTRIVAEFDTDSDQYTSAGCSSLSRWSLSMASLITVILFLIQ